MPASGGRPQKARNSTGKGISIQRVARAMAANMSSTTLNAPPVAREIAVPDIKAVYRLVTGDFDAVNALIPQRLTSDIDLVEQIGRHIIDSGGKRLRPLLVLLSARCR